MTWESISLHRLLFYDMDIIAGVPPQYGQRKFYTKTGQKGPQGE